MIVVEQVVDGTPSCERCGAECSFPGTTIFCARNSLAASNERGFRLDARAALLCEGRELSSLVKDALRRGIKLLQRIN